MEVILAVRFGESDIRLRNVFIVPFSSVRSLAAPEARTPRAR
jgi:hypothetical protein